MEEIPYDVKIFSAAKRFGLSGIRVGWAVTSWDDLDGHLQQLTETITSGVCVLAQSMVADILTMMSQSPEIEKKFYEECSNSFRANRESLVGGLGDSIDEETKLDILSKNGMFIWLHESKINTKSEVRIVRGDSFGSPGMVRLSIGAISASDAFLAGQRLRRSSEI
jgi:aspartate/methionine/tyrosine aminotransferase